MIIIDIEKIHKVKVNREDASFVDILTIRLRDFFDHQELSDVNNSSFKHVAV